MAIPAAGNRTQTMSDQQTTTYSIEGVMTNVSQGWILALDRPFAGEPGDSLYLTGSSPLLEVRVIGPVEQEDGTPVPDVIVIYPVQDMNDPRMLVGRNLQTEN